MVILYVRIVVIARSQIKRIRDHQVTGRQEDRGRPGNGTTDGAKWKAVRKFIAVTTAFWVSWAPYGWFGLFYLITAIRQAEYDPPCGDMNTTIGKRDIDLNLIVTEAMPIFVTAVLIIISNVMNIVIFSSNDKILPVGGRCFAISLATSDLVTGLAFSTSLIGCVTQEPVIASVFPLCAVLGATMHTATLTTTMSLLLMAVDRFIAVHWPLRYLVIITRKRAVVMALAGWISMAFYSVSLLAVGRDFYRYNNLSYGCMSHYSGHRVILAYIMLQLIPFAAMVILYVRIVVIARSQIKRIRDHQVTGRQEDRGRAGNGTTDAAKWKAVRMFIAVTTAFWVSWTPYTGLALFYLITGKHDLTLPDWIHRLAAIFAASNSFWNFIIYSAMNSSFRRAASLLD
ncbi:adenosine receptor A2b-like [Ptychodera flava]|uniref:adenosine receptor A2b-like n=1 Tax=Ptychodera flava TaxID=63121 RepID=UPI00396A2305